MTRLIIAISLLFLLGACADRPSDRTGRDAFEQYLKERIAGTEIDLTGFSKTDGQEFEQNGAKGYRLYFTSDVAFPRGYRCERSDSVAAGVNCLAVAVEIVGFKPLPPGSTLSFEGTIEFEKRERGWTPSKVQMVRSAIAAGAAK